MKKVYFKLLMLFGLVLISSSSVLSASVGTIPGSLSFNDIDRGNSIERSVYVQAFDVGANFSVNPTFSSYVSSSMFDEENDRIYSYSQQGSSDWFEAEEVTVNPETSYTVSGGGTESSVEGQFNLTLNVPDEAEPGIHRGFLRLNADIGTTGGTPGTSNIVETRIPYTITVPGEVQRNIVVQDVRAFRLGEDEAAVEVLLRNEGTVTTSTEDFQVDVLDATGATEATLTAGDAVLEPDEERYVEASWGSEDGIEEGAYQIDGEVDYLTGQATASGSFSLPGFDVVEVRPDDSPGSDEQDGRGGLPLWLVAMILVLLGVLMWSFGIDPFWILLIVGIFGISAFILMSGISNYLLILLLMVVGIVVYGGL